MLKVKKVFWQTLPVDHNRFGVENFRLEEIVINFLVVVGEVASGEFAVIKINVLVLGSNGNHLWMLGQKADLSLKAIVRAHIGWMHEGNKFPHSLFQRPVVADCRAVMFFIAVHLQ